MTETLLRNKKCTLYRVDNQYRINDWFVKTRTTAWESRYRS
ncbi:MAG: hypothetical protein ACTHM5_16255 [Ginsengibacter sp.]